jgi:hypothetical protein
VDSREFRDRWGLTLEELSDLIDVPVKTIANWGTDRDTPPDSLAQMETWDFVFQTLLNWEDRFPTVSRMFAQLLERRRGSAFRQVDYAELLRRLERGEWISDGELQKAAHDASVSVDFLMQIREQRARSSGNGEQKTIKKI